MVGERRAERSLEQDSQSACFQARNYNSPPTGRRRTLSTPGMPANALVPRKGVFGAVLVAVGPTAPHDGLFLLDIAATGEMIAKDTFRSGLVHFFPVSSWCALRG